MFGFRISRRFIAALFAGIGTILSDYKNPTTWLTGAGIIAAGAAAGPVSSKDPSASSLNRPPTGGF